MKEALCFLGIVGAARQWNYKSMQFNIKKNKKYEGQKNRWVCVSKFDVIVVCREMRLYIRQSFHHVVICWSELQEPFYFSLSLSFFLFFVWLLKKCLVLWISALFNIISALVSVPQVMINIIWQWPASKLEEMYKNIMEW